MMILLINHYYPSVTRCPFLMEAGHHDRNGVARRRVAKADPGVTSWGGGRRCNWMLGQAAKDGNGWHENLPTSESGN